MADIVKLLEEYLAEHDVPPFHTTLRNGVPVRRIYEAILYLNDQLEEAQAALVPARNEGIREGLEMAASQIDADAGQFVRELQPAFYRLSTKIRGLKSSAPEKQEKE